MKTNRRTFIKQSAFAVASVAATNSLLSSCAPPSSSNASAQLTGVQLYSIRDEMVADALGTLKQLSAMGYKYVEHADYVDRKFYGWAAVEFKKVLSDLGISMPSGYTVFGKDHWDEATNDFTDKWKFTVEDAAIVGQQFVISPWLDEAWRDTESNLKKYMDVFNKSGELCKKSGMRFGYHNHAFEFSQMMGDKSVYDIMLENTSIDLVVHQLDIGNLYNGGAKAIDIVTKFPGRFQSMHVKDEIPATEGEEKYESTILGKGIVGVKEVIDLGKKSGGTIHFIIEQESYQGKTPLDCVKEDLEIMKTWGYV